MIDQYGVVLLDQFIEQRFLGAVALVADATGGFLAEWSHECASLRDWMSIQYPRCGSHSKHTISHHQAMMQAIERQDADAAEQAAQADADILPSRLTDRLVSKPSARISFNNRQSVR